MERQITSFSQNRPLLQRLTQTYESNRIATISEQESKPQIQGDFEGSVTGSWKGLDTYGLGKVGFKDKEYKTKPMGFTSITRGQSVQLTFANGVYYSSW